MDSNSPADIPDATVADSLRSQHGTDEVIARVNGSTTDSGINRVEGHAAAFEMWTDEDLHKRAAEVGIDPEGMSRDDLIRTLQGH